MWPSWDARGPTHRQIRDYFRTYNVKPGTFRSRVGSMRVTSRKGIELDMGCQCLFVASSDKLVMCEFGDEEYLDDFEQKYGSHREVEGFEAINRMCKYQITMPVQYYSELEAIRGEYVPFRQLSRTPVILDIDLDYFGVQGPLDSEFGLGGIADEPQRALERTLKNLHVKTVADEFKINQALRQEVGAFVDKRTQCCLLSISHFLSLDSRHVECVLGKSQGRTGMSGAVPRRRSINKTEVCADAALSQIVFSRHESRHHFAFPTLRRFAFLIVIPFDSLRLTWKRLERLSIPWFAQILMLPV